MSGRDNSAPAPESPVIPFPIVRPQSVSETSHAVSDADIEAEVHARYAQDRLERFLGRRPAKFAIPGALDTRLAAWTQALAAGATGNLVITGNTGTGKSWSAWRIGEELLRSGWRGRVEIIGAYQLKTLAAPPIDTMRLAGLASAGLLVLDDVGAVRVSDWDADHLYGVVDERWANDRPTIVIANATAPTEPGKSMLAVLLGERVASRIADNVTVVTLTGADRRRQP